MKNKKTIIFYLSYFLFIFSYMFSNVNMISNLTDKMRFFSLILMTLNIIIQSNKYSKKAFVMIILLCIFSIISYYFSKDISLLLLLLFIIGAKNIELKSFIKRDMYLKIVFTIIVVFLYYIGFTENFIISRATGSIRESMGFAHPNVFGSFVFSICCDYLYLKMNSKQNLKYIIVIIMLCVIYIFSDSRTSIISLLFLMAYDFFYNRINKKIFDKKIIKHITKNVILYGLIFTLILTYLYQINNKIGVFINDNTSQRLAWISKFINAYNYNLFGHDFKIVGTYNSLQSGQNQWILDNSYVYLILKFGVLGFGIFYFFFRKLIEKLLSNKNYTLIIIILSFCIYGFMETGLFRLQYNSFLILFSLLIYDNNMNLEEN